MSAGDRAVAASSGRRPLSARAVAWPVVALYVVGMAAIFVLERRLGPQGDGLVEELVVFGGFGMFAAVGALLVSRRPGNPVGWIMCAASLVVAVAAGETYAAYVMTTSGRPDWLAVLGVWANSWYWLLFLGLVLVYLPLLFPDGRLPSRRWLPVAVVPGIALVTTVVLGALAETLRGQEVGYRIENPIGIEGLAHVEGLPVIFVSGGLLIFGAVAAVVTVAVRFRRSRGAERQQLKWFLYAAAPIPVLPLSDFAPAGIESAASIISTVAFAWVLFGIPVSVGIAVLRYRLYDIDILINRTLVYGSLTATLALVYVGSVVGLQRLLSPLTGEGNRLAVVASTLAIAALFNPLRRRVQAFVDRRFYRRKYDAERTLEAFSERLRKETDLGALSEDLVGVVWGAVQPEQASIWLRPASGRSSGAEERVR